MACVHPGQGKGGHMGWPQKLRPQSTFLWAGPWLFTSLVLCSHAGRVGVATTTAVGVIGGFWSWVVAVAWAHCPGSL